MMSKALAMHGAKVYIASRKRAVVDKAAAELNALPEVKASGGLVVPLQADLNSKANCDKLASEIEKLEGGPGKAKMEALICNSGITWGAPLETFPEEKGWKNVLNVNVVGVYYRALRCWRLRGIVLIDRWCRSVSFGSMDSDNGVFADAPTRGKGGGRSGEGDYPRFGGRDDRAGVGLSAFGTGSSRYFL